MKLKVFIDGLSNIFVKKKLSICIVEDNQYYAQLIKANISNKGFGEIKIFNDAESLIESFKYGVPKCIILDHILSPSGLNGVDVLKHIKKYHPRINVIVISGQENVKIASDLMKYGAFDYIVKNDMAFFNLENTLFKLSRIMVIEDNNVAKYSIIAILFMTLVVILFFFVL